ncbi:unnamed protein product [Miscanthus lutarioriparius]|uniref:Uncharacterized protein n=1 Tax=Miscanthus lutarioriparius TaxID=422564 RepID=A0A811RAQ2_9POAL|nr:unnamed protein product [Miscanthus lutarioriparius]CAD6267274.1 unnamed protein product [Miscanthus lutarioriparius]
MEGSKAVLFLILILGCFMIPTHSRNVVHVCPCQIATCQKGSNEAVCYCCSQDNCYATSEDCYRYCRCPPKSKSP